MNYNSEKVVMIKDRLLKEIKKLLMLIEKVNDGTFEIQDNVSDEIINW